jgi:hypothetical protein
MSKTMTHPASVPPIVAHMFRPTPAKPKTRPQPLVGILAELATTGNY